MQNGDVYLIGVGGYDGTNPEEANSLQDSLGGNPMISITYNELKSLRNNSQLIPDTQYRITDYSTTVAISSYAVGNHRFDVIVVADDINKLNENARAAHHNGDTYFSNSKLETWELKYCLDNDTNRFTWADSTNGKGVIYYMKDEFNNECTYDFKNIMFYRKWDSTKSAWSEIVTRSTSGAVACYTFSSEGNSSTTSFTDLSLSKDNNIYSNVIKKNVVFELQDPNNNCFFGSNCYNNTFEYYCYNNTFGKSCQNNTFGYQCTNNTFGNYCSNNTFKEYCGNNIFKNQCNRNIFGSTCGNNSFGRDCNYNIFEYSCNWNVFGSSCSYNTFGFKCSDITFALNYSGTAGDYFQYNTLGNEVKYCIIYSLEAASSTNLVKNYNIKSFIAGTYSANKRIEVTRNLDYETTIAKNSSGTLKTYCEADLIN